MRISTAIVVLNWNRSKDTICCLESILKLNINGPLLIIVCDNHSSDDSLDQLGTWLQSNSTANSNCVSQLEFALLKNDTNKGYSGGNNVGIRYALEHHADFIWILNNDTQVTPNSLSHLLHHTQVHPKIGGCGSTLIDANNNIQCAGGSHYFPALTIGKDIFHDRSVNWAIEQKESVDLDYVSGASMFLRSDALRKVGLLNEQFFLYYEELDLAKRLKQAGYDLGWCKESIVQHQQGSSTRQHIDHEKVAQYHENLSTLIYTRIHHPGLLPFAGLFRLSAKFVLLPVRGQAILLGSVLKAYVDFIRGNYPQTTVRPGTETRVIRKVTLGAKSTHDSIENDL